MWPIVFELKKRSITLLTSWGPYDRL